MTASDLASASVLAFDCACNACSAAVWQEGGLSVHRFQRMTRGHAEALVPMIAEVLAEAGIGFGALDTLAVSTGPGSFTGVRLGLSAAEGLVIATGLPVFALTTTELVARGAREVWEAAAVGAMCAPPLLVALDAKRAELWVELFLAPGRAGAGPVAVHPSALASWLRAQTDHVPMLAGSAAAVAEASLAADGLTVRRLAAEGEPDAGVLAAVAAAAFSGDASHACLTAAVPPPLYLRPPDTTVAKRGIPRAIGPTSTQSIPAHGRA